MTVKNVTATRMTLLGLKNQTFVAQRGHKLLKDKQDGLMQEFLKIISEAKKQRKNGEIELEKIYKLFFSAQIHIEKTFLETTIASSAQKLTLNVKTKNIISCKIPKFKLQKEGNPIEYGFIQTRSDLDIALKRFGELFHYLVQLSEIEKTAENLSQEIEKTRRRINAIEHKFIPDLKEILKFIQMKLAESERSSIVQTMIIKNIIEKQETENKK